MRLRETPPATGARRSAARPASSAAATALVDSHGRRLAGLERDVTEREYRAFATDARVALGGDDDARTADTHRAAHVLLDRDLRLEKSAAAGIGRGGAI